MGFKKSLLEFVMQLMFTYVFLISGLIIWFLILVTYLTVWPFNRTLYRQITSRLAYFLYAELTGVGQWWGNMQLSLVSENPEDLKLLGKEHVVAVVGHKYEIDWLFTMILAERCGVLGSTKIYGKNSLRYVPVLGWIWDMTESIFLKREWDKDKQSLVRDLACVTQYPPDQRVTCLLYCEGTRFTAEKHVVSNEVARKKGMPELKHHLLPRTKGFVLTMQGIQGKLQSILDVTFGMPSTNTSIKCVLEGNGPKCEAFIRRIPLDQVPMESEACAQWLHQLYREKDAIFDDYHQNGTFTKGTKVELPRRANDLLTVVMWFALIMMPTLYYTASFFIFGSLWTKGFILGTILLLYLLKRNFLKETTLNKSSSVYGRASNDQPNNGKKTD